MAVIPSPLTAAAANSGGPSSAAPSHDSLIDLKEVCRRTGLGRSTITKLITAGTFPKRVKVTGRSTRWSAQAVQTWIEERIAASTGPGR